jgi:hypothetical protein
MLMSDSAQDMTYSGICKMQEYEVCRDRFQNRMVYGLNKIPKLALVPTPEHSPWIHHSLPEQEACNI